VRPGEVVPIPPLEVELGALQPHQRLPHGDGEPVVRAPAEHSESQRRQIQSRKQKKRRQISLQHKDFGKANTAEKKTKNEFVNAKEGDQKDAMDWSNR
jgi:hypothetical protein